MEENNNTNATKGTTEEILKLQSYEDLAQDGQAEQDGIVASVMENYVEKNETVIKKPNIFRLMVAALSLDKNREEDQIYTLLKPVKTLKYLIVFAVMCLMLYLMSKLVDSKLFLPLLLTIAPCALPCLFIVFNYEIADKTGVSFFKLFCSFFFGMLLHVVINTICNTFLVRSIYKSTIDILIVPILWGLGELTFVALLSKMYNISQTSTNILIAVCVGMGYAVISAMQTMFSSFFVSVEIIVSGNEHYNGSAIIDNSLYLVQALEQAMDSLFFSCIFFPTLIMSWSVVVGNVVSVTEVFGKKSKGNFFSVYLLLVLVIILYALTVFPSSFGYLDVIFKIICTIISLYITVRLQNNSLEERIKNLPQTDGFNSPPQ